MEKQLKNLLHCKSLNCILANNAAQGLSEFSQNNGNTTSRKIQGTLVSPTAFNFNHFGQNIKNADQGGRIHGKMGTKRQGGKVMLALGKSKKKPAKESKLSNKRVAQMRRSEGSPNIKALESPDPSHFIYIKSFQPASRFSSIEIQHNTEYNGSHQKNVSDLSESSKQEPQAGDLFKEIKRKLEKNVEHQHNLQKKKKCFYINLKRKLQLELKRSTDKENIHRMKFVIEGCNAHIHSKTSTRIGSRSSSVRGADRLSVLSQPKLAFTDRDRSNVSRPKSCKSSLCQSSRYFRDLKNKNIEIVISRPTKNKFSVKQRSSSSSKSNLSKNSLNNENPKIKSNKQLVQKSSVKKMTQIINDCSNEQGFEELDTNMKAFQHYCKQFDEKLKYASEKLREMQSNYES